MREIVFGSADASEGWPYVERLCNVDGRPAWAVDDAGLRYVVLNTMVFDLEDLMMAEPKIQRAAHIAFPPRRGGRSMSRKDDGRILVALRDGLAY